MNAGFSNLFDLKRELLLSGDATGTELDGAVQEYGMGVARMFESLCNRRFERIAGDTIQFDPYRISFVVPRYPIESVASVELRYNISEGFVSQSDQPWNYRRESGLVLFGAVLGTCDETGRITYTGGYWWETKEPTDVGYPTSIPSGAELLPRDLKLAWLQQCKFFWDRRSIEDRAKAGFEQGKGFTGEDTEILPTVVEVLDQYRRFS